MQTVKNRKEATRKRHGRIRKTIEGCAERPRMSVYRSLKHISVQLIDDENQVTLASASSMDPALKDKLKHGGNLDAAKLVGELISKRAQEKGIQTVVFDRGGNVYRGRVSALAQAARDAGLFF